MAKGYRIVENESIEEILSKIQFDEESNTDNLGTFFTISEFIQKVNDWELIDYIGNGYLEIDGKMVIGSISWIWFKSFAIGEDYIISFDKIEKMFGDRARILWIEERK